MAFFPAGMAPAQMNRSYDSVPMAEYVEVSRVAASGRPAINRRRDSVVRPFEKNTVPSVSVTLGLDGVAVGVL